MELTEYLEGCREDLKTLGIHLQDLSLQSEEALKNITGTVNTSVWKITFCFTDSFSVLWFNFRRVTYLKGFSHEILEFNFFFTKINSSRSN